MTGPSIDQILGYKNLSSVISNPLGGVPNRLPAKFLSITEDQVGNQASWTEVKNTRQVASIVAYGSPAKRRNLQGITDRSAIMLHSYEKHNYKPLLLQLLRQFDNSDMQRRGQQMVSMQLAEFRRLFENARLAAIYSILRYGAIYYDGNGNLLPSSSGAAQTVNFNVSATHKNQCDSIIAATWSTAATDIISHVNNLKTRALKDTGYPLAHAFYGSSVLGYLLKNDGVKELLKTQSGMAAAFKSGTIPNGFLELEWIPIQDAFYADADGTNQDLSAADQVTFTPAPEASWWTMLQGSYTVPTNLGTHSDASAAIRSFDDVFGMFSYAKVTDDPPGVEQFFGDTYLPTLKVPDSIFIADVAF